MATVLQHDPYREKPSTHIKLNAPERTVCRTCGCKRSDADSVRKGCATLMVGGVIVDIVPIDEHRIWVNCADTSRAIPETCAVYVDPVGVRLQVKWNIEVGDSLWWQGDSAFWTPSGGSLADIRLKRLSYSGVPHPHLPPREHGLGAVRE